MHAVVQYGLITLSGWPALERRMNVNKYNKEAVNKEIKKDPRIKGKEAKLISRLLIGRKVRVTNPDLLLDPSKPGNIKQIKVIHRGS